MVPLPEAVRPDAGDSLNAARALCLHVEGVVQGVGFRPFVHRLALEHGLAGFVRNAAGDVEILIEGEAGALERFVRDLRGRAPPLAQIEQIAAQACQPEGRGSFQILGSVDEPGRRQPVSPDVALCGACRGELRNPANRRYRYPFITCTDCGPRFTVIEAMPYDRERTSMRAFQQCPACLAEYHASGDRRYHSETNSCPVCGPRLWLEYPGRDGVAERGDAALSAAADLLACGGVVAVRGLGGFHLAADATDEAAVGRLRRRKLREAKPLAVMVATLEQARQLGEVGELEAGLLTGPERPIVLLRRRPDAGLAPSVAPGLGWVGVMLAYTPLHHLLLDLAGRPLVMTSGNLSEEPIAMGNAEARERLGMVADAFLLHDREIISRYDDSVLRVADGLPIMLRRARGYAPLPLPLPVPAPVPLVAVGPHLKNTLTLAQDGRAWVSQHIGDLENLETLEQFRATLERYRTLFRIDPVVAVRDLHPGYLSTRIADELGLSQVLAVQHHHAHIAAVLAEHGREGPVVGVAFDGTGYGDDGNIWGGEILIAGLLTYRRVGHLRYAPLPGGDLAARNPWRSALGYLLLEPHVASAFQVAFEGVDPRERALAEYQGRHGINAPLASSLGRLFDAAAAVIGVRRAGQYEGQAAMELESLAGRRIASELPLRLEEQDGMLLLDPVPLLARLGTRRQSGADPADLAADFHATVAWATARMVERACEISGLGTVALAGGVFQNARLLASVRRRLSDQGLEVLLPRRLSPNDGAISYGQAAIAAARLRAGAGLVPHSEEDPCVLASPAAF